MLTKIKTFCSFFADFQNCFTLLGGAACTAWYTNHQPRFRPTIDVDIVLCREALSPVFISRFHEYMERYGYQGEAYKVNNEEKARMYRLQTTHPDVPAQIELLSRKGDCPILPSHQHKAPLTFGNESTGLSCILMDDAYYHLLHQHLSLIDGIPLPAKAVLIALKIKAYLNIRQMRAAATPEQRQQRLVPSEDEMNKHRNDVFFLLMDMQPQREGICVSPPIADDIRCFIQTMNQDKLWQPVFQSLRQLRKESLRALSPEKMVDTLKKLFFGCSTKFVDGISQPG